MQAPRLQTMVGRLRGLTEPPAAVHDRSERRQAERDGSGYPRGLRGEAIPLPARLFAVVDVWDALCSDRPYRKGWAREAVLAHIQQGAGTHFDARVVEAFLALMVEAPGQAAAAPASAA